MANAGELNVNAKLDWAAVREIRAAVGDNDVDLADRFHVSKTTIRSVRRNRTWVDGEYMPRHSPRSPHRLRGTK